MTRAVLRVGDPDHPERLVTAAAGLALAGDSEWATPRLLGVDLAGAAGISLPLMSALARSSKIPEVASTRRLGALGVAAAALHNVALTPRAELATRLRRVADGTSRSSAVQPGAQADLFLGQAPPRAVVEWARALSRAGRSGRRRAGWLRC